MRAAIRGLHSTFVDNLESYTPPDPAVFRIPITLLAGPADGAGQESFDFEVCSPGWIGQEIKKGDVRLLRHVLVMTNFDFDAVRQFVERYVGGIEGSSWQEIAQKLSRLGHWELEDLE